MKLICLNVDECGFSEEIEQTDIVDVNDFRCKLCLAIALPYTDNYKPIIMETEENFEAKSSQLLASLYNVLNTPKKE